MINQVECSLSSIQKKGYQHDLIAVMV